MKPEAPTNDLSMPWAYGGDKTIIPAETAAAGRATQKEGFPPVTQIPIREGGVAPSRSDFNGMFYLLSALNFWQQSGGMMTWKSTLSYVPPSIVFHNGGFWACVAENGPESDMGAAVQPGTDETYWQTLLAYLSTNTGGAANTGIVAAGNTVTLTGDTTGTGTFGENGNVSVATTTAQATKLRTARTISLTGSVTGSASFDGTANISIATTIGGGAGGDMVPDWPNSFKCEKSTWYTADSNGYFLLKYGGSSKGDLKVKSGSSSFSWYIRNGGDEFTIAVLPLYKGDKFYSSCMDTGANIPSLFIPVRS